MEGNHERRERHENKIHERIISEWPRRSRRSLTPDTSNEAVFDSFYFASIDSFVVSPLLCFLKIFAACEDFDRSYYRSLLRPGAVGGGQIRNVPQQHAPVAARSQRLAVGAE